MQRTWTIENSTLTLSKGFFRLNEPLSKHIPLRCGGMCRAWIELCSMQELQTTLQFLRKLKIKYRIHHPFEDWLVHDHGFDGVIIRMRGIFEQIQEVSEKRDEQGSLIHASGIRVGVSALWSQIYFWQDILGEWTGSVGGVIRNEQRICLRGWEYTLEIYKGKQFVYEFIDAKTTLRSIAPTELLTHVILHQPPKRKQNIRTKPLRNGELFLRTQGKSIQQKRCGELLEVQDLYGTRLRGWSVERFGGVFSHVPYMRESGQSTTIQATSDVLELYKGIREKIQRRMGIEIALAVALIGRSKK